jgi:hypothetical protein
VQHQKWFAAIINAGRKMQNQAAVVHTRLAGGGTRADKRDQAVQPQKCFAAIINAGRKRQNQAAVVHTRLAGGRTTSRTKRLSIWLIYTRARRICSLGWRRNNKQNQAAQHLADLHTHEADLHAWLAEEQAGKAAQHLAGYRRAKRLSIWLDIGGQSDAAFGWIGRQSDATGDGGSDRKNIPKNIEASTKATEPAASQL